MAAKTITIYAGEYGNTIRARTLCDDIGDATQIKVRFKKSDGTKANLDASAVPDDTEYYAVDAVLTSGWSDDKAGSWDGQVELTFAGGLFYGKPFTLRVVTPPGI